MFPSQFRDVRAVGGGVAQQPEIERVTRAGGEVGVIGQDDGRQGARQVGGVE